MEINILDNDYLYISDIVEFINEFRLFIGKNKIYGGVESTDILINSEKSVSIKPPEDFLNKVLVPFYLVLKYSLYHSCWSKSLASLLITCFGFIFKYKNSNDSYSLQLMILYPARLSCAPQTPIPI